jgi:hypothetical protein
VVVIVVGKSVEYLYADRKIILKKSSRKGASLCSPGNGPLVGFCEHRGELQNSIECGNILYLFSS